MATRQPLAYKAEQDFKAFKDSYSLFLGTITEHKWQDGRAVKCLVLIRDKRTLNALKKWWVKWDEHRDNLSKYDRFDLTKPSFTNPGVVHHTVSDIRYSLNACTMSEKRTKKQLINALQRAKKPLDRELQKDTHTKSEVALITAHQNQLLMVTDQVKRSKCDKYRWRKPVGTVVDVRLFRNLVEDGCNVTLYGAKGEEEVEFKPGVDWAKLQAKALGLFVLDLEKKIEVRKADSQFRKKRGDSIDDSDAQPLDLEGIIAGKFYKIDELKNRTKTVLVVK